MRWLDGITDSMDMSLNKLGGGERQGSLACCSPWGHKESDVTDQLNNHLTRETEDKGAGLGARTPFKHVCVCVCEHVCAYMSEEVGDPHCPDCTFSGS